jgi:hypothetical protein
LSEFLSLALLPVLLGLLSVGFYRKVDSGPTFLFCWWASSSEFLKVDAPAEVVVAPKKDEADPTTTEAVERGKKKAGEKRPLLLSWPKALRKVRGWLADRLPPFSCALNFVSNPIALSFSSTRIICSLSSF